MQGGRNNRDFGVPFYKNNFLAEPTSQSIWTKPQHWLQGKKFKASFTPSAWVYRRVGFRRDDPWIGFVGDDESKVHMVRCMKSPGYSVEI